MKDSGLEKRISAITDTVERCYRECEGGCPQYENDKCQCNKAKDLERLKELAEYRRLEEEGLLLKLPCKIGDTIYKIPSKVNYDLNVLNGNTRLNRVYEQTVYCVSLWKNDRYLIKTCEGLDTVLSDSYGETWFLKREDAERALESMGGAK